MTDTIAIVYPCYNECIRVPASDDQPASLMGALHGNFCDREFFRVRASLHLAAPTVEHVVSLIHSKGQDDSRVDTSREAPMPFNTQAFNDANELYQRLVYWCRVFADLLSLPAPGPAMRAWRNRAGEIIGLPADISASGARYASGIMSTWLETHLEAIFDIRPDDVLYFHDEMKDVFRVAARFPTRMRSRYADVHCPDDGCGGRLVVYPPEKFMDDQRIVCETCGRHIMPDDYAFMVGVMEEQKAVELKSKRVQERLAQKYGAA